MFLLFFNVFPFCFFELEQKHLQQKVNYPFYQAVTVVDSM